MGKNVKMLTALVIIGFATTVQVPSVRLTGVNTTANVTATINTTSTLNTTSSTLCLEPCSCSIDSNGLLAMKCLLSQLPNGWTIPPGVKSLDLSYNGLTQVPTVFFRQQNLSHLESLSLQGNNISTIVDGAFDGLYNLTRLDLSFINLREWQGNISRSLPSLKYVDTTGNFPWIPSLNLLDVKTLRKIIGVTWSSSCFNCTLQNMAYMDETEWATSEEPSPDYNNTTTVYHNQTLPPTGEEIGGLPEEMGGQPYGPQIPDDKKDNMANVFYKHNFVPICMDVPNDIFCSPTTMEYPSKAPGIFSLPSRLFYVAYVLGALVIILNLSIIFIYIYSNSMRKVNSMLLISNMAACDVLVGVYCIIIAKINIFNVLLDQSTSKGPIKVSGLCPVASVLFTLGQTVSVLTGLLLTIDKYLSIVYCMDPNRKLSRRLSLFVIALCWIATLMYALSPRFGSHSGLVYSPVLLCTLPVTEEKGIVVSFVLLVVLYLANIPLYGKIFLFVRRSSARMGVSRDAILAKKIALLIFTNFLFFVVPMTILIVYIFMLGIHFTLLVDESNATLTRIILCYWLPVTCLGVNSCLNPFLCAFRQRQFRREVKKCARNCLMNRLFKAFSTIRSDSSVRTAPPTRVETYKLSKIESQVM